MEKVMELEGKKFRVRGLKRREVKQFKKDGIRFNQLEPDTADDVADKVFEQLGLCLDDIDDLTNSNALTLFQEIMSLTFMTEEQRKNSSSPSTS
jgi:hypothetical protein